jgi:hypothetical protein
MASHNFLILSDKSRPVLDLICNRFAAELNEISVSQEEFGDQKLTKEDPAFRYGRCDSNDPSKEEILTTFEIGAFHL